MLIAPLLLLGLAAAPAQDAGLQPGMWRAWLDSPGGELPFGLEVEHVKRGSQPTALPEDIPIAIRCWIINGSERISPTESVWVKDESGKWWIEIRFAHYDSVLRAMPRDGGQALTGNWLKVRGKQRHTHMPFHAQYAPDQAQAKQGMGRFATRPYPPGTQPIQLEPQYRVQFESSADPAIGRFTHAANGVVHGTFLTTTGDYRYLAGQVDPLGLRLSCFDGAHAFLFTAARNGKGKLQGHFYSRDTWHETWTASVDANIKLPDPWKEVGLVPAEQRPDWRKFEVTQLDGSKITLGDTSLHGKARILVLFGSWCPNCHDEHNFLKQLHNKFAGQGLAIQSLAFELGGDTQRDLAQLKRYQEQMQLDWPILLVASTADKKLAAEAFPILTELKSYPTTLFIDKNGEIQAVHSGFSGPATGEEHERLQRDFTQRVQSLLRQAD